MNRSKLFGVIINPKLDEPIEWKSMSKSEIVDKLKKLKFPNRFVMTEILNQVQFLNVNKNLTGTEDFSGQLEIGNETSIPHYQLAIKSGGICTKKQVLKGLEEKLDAHINVDIQHNFENMKGYCTKETKFISDKYSGRVFKKQWKESFLDKKPNLKNIIENPYPWQKLLKNQLLIKEPDDRIVDWLIDPVGNTGKSSFARAYCSEDTTDAILMKIDNLDRMELSLINKINHYRDRYYKDPKIIFFDFPRASNMLQVMQATALMEDAKSGYLESNFGGKHKNIKISNVHVIVLANTAPDLSVLSVDRWRLWRLGGENYGNIIWPCKTISNLQSFDKDLKTVTWNIRLENLIPSDVLSNPNFNQFDLPVEWHLMEHKKNPLSRPIWTI